jgi:hypothetical protein
VKHLHRLSVVAVAVIEEVLALLLGLGLGCNGTSTFEALGAGNRGHDGGKVGELLGLKGDKLITGLGGLQSTGRRLTGGDQRINPSRFLTTPAWVRMASWKPASAFCQRVLASAISCVEDVAPE